MVFLRTIRRSKIAPTVAEKRPAAPTLPRLLWQATIPVTPVRRQAAREIALVRGIPRLVLSGPASRWQRRALAAVQACRPLRPITLAIAIECRVWDETPDRPIDELLLVELLERGAVIASERQIRERHVIHGRDAARPRIELSVSGVEEGHLRATGQASVPRPDAGTAGAAPRRAVAGRGGAR